MLTMMVDELDGFQIAEVTYDLLNLYEKELVDESQMVKTKKIDLESMKKLIAISR